jgi:hypothetical protein
MRKATHDGGGDCGQGVNILDDVADQPSFAMLVRIREPRVGRRASAILGEAVLDEAGRHDPVRPVRSTGVGRECVRSRKIGQGADRFHDQSPVR